MASKAFTVTIEGIDEAMHKIGPVTWDKPTEDYFERVGHSVLGEARKLAPVDSGRTAGSMAKGGAGNIWQPGKDSLRIGTDVTHNSFSYPRHLDESSKTRYRGGKAAGKRHKLATAARHKQRAGLLGRKTKGWFSGAPERAKSDIAKALNRYRRDILKRWVK